MTTFKTPHIETLLEEGQKAAGTYSPHFHIPSSILHIYSQVNTDGLLDFLYRLFPGDIPVIKAVNPNTGEVSVDFVYDGRVNLPLKQFGYEIKDGMYQYNPRLRRDYS